MDTTSSFRGMRLEESEIWATLERGGAVRRQPREDQREGHTRPGLSKYNGLLDPPGAELLAGTLAERLVASGATLVVVWEDVEDIVLGFVVGQRLGVPVLRTYNADGLVGQAGPLPRAARAVLVTDCLRDSVASRAVRALLERSGGELLGVAALVDAGEAEDAPLVSLAQIEHPLAEAAGGG